MTDGTKLAAPCPDCSDILVRTWDSLDPVAASVYGIDPSYADLVVFAYYDASDGETPRDPNTQNAIIESNLPAGVVPPPGAVTDLDWYQLGVGLTVQIGVDAATGNLGTKYVLVDYFVPPPIAVQSDSWSSVKEMYRDE